MGRMSSALHNFMMMKVDSQNIHKQGDADESNEHSRNKRLDTPHIRDERFFAVQRF